jgi:dimethylamine/trimethylamine dehydrogenase
MVRQITLGFHDCIGAAGPFTAGPFLPKKIEEGRYEDIANASAATSASGKT